MFLSDPGSLVGGKTENESPWRQSQYVGTWLEFLWMTDRVLGQRRGKDPGVWSVGKME